MRRQVTENVVTHVGTLLAIACALALPLAPGPAHAQSQVDHDAAMNAFRHRAEAATARGLPGAFPNFYVGGTVSNPVGGTIFVRSTVAEWQDVPHNDMGAPPLNNFAEWMRMANLYASRKGYVGAFPNYFYATKSNRIVCGTLLLKGEGVEWRDVPAADLKNPPIHDIGARFRATQDYAVREGFVGGFPNFYHADYGRGLVYGTILLRPGFAFWADVSINPQISVRTERHQLGGWIYIEGKYFSPGSRVLFRARGIRNFQGDYSLGYTDARANGTFSYVWDARCGPAGTDNVTILAIDVASGFIGTGLTSAFRCPPP